MTVMPPPLTRPRTPPLESGDVLTRDEFERRYDAMPEVKKAELIEGVVYMPSPVRWDAHGAPHADLVWLLTHYSGFTPGTSAADNATIQLDDDNEFQPDVTLIVDPDHGGRVRIPKYVVGSPDLVAEISASSASIDMNQKLRVYRRNQVREYLVHRVYDQAIDWFIYRNTQFERIEPDARGILKSEAFPGLWLNPTALLNSDFVALHETVNEGLASPEHAAFVARLRDAGPNSQP